MIVYTYYICSQRNLMFNRHAYCYSCACDCQTKLKEIKNVKNFFEIFKDCLGPESLSNNHKSIDFTLLTSTQLLLLKREIDTLGVDQMRLIT